MQMYGKIIILFLGYPSIDVNICKTRVWGGVGGEWRRTGGWVEGLDVIRGDPTDSQTVA